MAPAKGVPVIELGMLLVKAHYRIPRSGFFALVIAGTALLVVWPLQEEQGATTIAAVGSACVGIGVVGLIRWWRLSHPAPMMVICRFASESDEPRARELQSRIVTELSDSLPRHLRILEVPETVGTNQREFAAALSRRLHSPYVLFGTIAKDGTLDPRLLRPSGRTIEHWDDFTRDRTPQRTLWGTVVDRLTGEAEDETALPVVAEAEGLVRGLEARVLLAIGEPRRAERSFREAIRLTNDSASHAVDDLRLGLAEAVFSQDRAEEALRMLISRASEEDASPLLLRHTALLILRLDPPDKMRDMAVGFLRRAGEHRGDPERDMTLYNLAKVLTQSDATRQEGWDILRDLATFPSSHYHRAWYVAREFGVEQFLLFQRLTEDGDTDGAQRAARASARWYAKAIRWRPKHGLHRTGPRPWHLRLGPEPSPIMVANFIDAHRAAGHRIRRFIWEVRLAWMQRRFSKKARRYASVEDWFGAYKYVEWMYVGRRDHADVFSRVAAAVAAEKAERPDLAEERWKEAGEMEPHLDVWREAVESWFGFRESQNKS